MKYLRFFGALMLMAASLALPTPAVATDYSPADDGFITNALAQIDGTWQPRPGLTEPPLVATSLAAVPLQWDVAPGSPIAAVAVWALIEGQDWALLPSSYTGSQVSAQIPAIDPAWFSPCQPHLRVAFYIAGKDADGNPIEVDERAYLDEPGGDPYFYWVANPAPNQPPVANPGGPYETFNGTDLLIDGTGSSDPEGSPLTYEWDIFSTWMDYYGSEWFQDDEYDNGSTATVTANFRDGGQYHARLRVTDACGESAIDEAIINVLTPHMVILPQHNQVNALYFMEGMHLTLAINDQVVASASAGFMDEGTGFGASWGYEEHGQQIVPGDEIVIWGDLDTSQLGDEVVKVHIVRAITITAVDLDLNQMSGTGNPNQLVRARLAEPYWLEEVVTTDDAGLWTAQFAVDLQEDTQMAALQQNDDDASHTLAVWETPEPPAQPMLMVEPDHGWAQTERWTIGSVITLTIDDDADPANGVLYTDTQPATPADWDPAIGAAFFNLNENRALLQPGVYLTATDGTQAKQVMIVDGAIEPVNSALGRVSGYGPPNQPAELMVVTPSEEHNFQFSYGADGSFAIDTAMDLHSLRDVNMVAWDADHDGVMRHLANPSLQGASMVPALATPNTPVTISAALLGNTYADQASIHNAVFHIWGYGTDLPAVLDDGFPVTNASISLAIAQPGVYPVEVAGYDDIGYEVREFLGYLVIYDPNGGFVTGGGSIYSPAGAYLPDPALQGKATFGFVSKYLKGANIPSGQTEFQFRAAGLNFKSSAYEWMVIAGKKVMYKGQGSINGSGVYQFMLSAIDGDLKGGDGLDRFRIRIWQVVDGVEQTVYDNQLNDYPDADPTTTLTGGSIVIHK